MESFFHAKEIQTAEKVAKCLQEIITNSLHSSHVAKQIHDYDAIWSYLEASVKVY